MTSKANNKTPSKTPKAKTPSPKPSASNPTPARKTPARKRTKRRRQSSKLFTADQKVQAVLAAWTEKLTQSEICRQLEINYVTFQSWQNRAMEGMLQALENNVRLTDGAILSPRLRKLMEKRRGSPEDRLEDRLRKIQEGSDTSPLV